MKINIHIGRVIQNEVFKLNISLYELSGKMNMSEKSLLNIFCSKTIELSLLLKLSCVLGINFFSIYSELLDEDCNNFKLDTFIS